MNKTFIKNMQEEMVEFQLRRRGIVDQRVLQAMQSVPRHSFIDIEYMDEAYADGPLPIGHGQTISQPYIVAFMTEKLEVEPNHTVLEIGTGYGYQTAVLSLLVKKVITVERIQALAESAKSRLIALGFNNAAVICANGWNGYEESAPYDRIMVAACPRSVPKPLITQLANNGRMVIPVGNTFSQQLQIISKDALGIVNMQESIPVRFVQLINK